MRNASSARPIFVNLPVRDLERSKRFFGELGFEFDPQFTDEKAACMIIGQNIRAMLITEGFFKSFTTKDVCDSARYTEVINSLTAGSREEVDEFMEKALGAGATEPRDPQAMEFIYGRSFQDPDGHLWEIFYIEASAVPETVAGESAGVGATADAPETR